MGFLLGLINSHKILLLSLALIFVASSSATAIAEQSVHGPLGFGIGPDGRSTIPTTYGPSPDEGSQGVAAYEISAAVAEEDSCNCVIFRLDDVQDFFALGTQLDIMADFTERGQHLSVGPIFSVFDVPAMNGTTPLEPGNATKVGEASGLFEVFNHGWNDTNYQTASVFQQNLTIALAQNATESRFVNPVNTFVPPMNLYNGTTLDVMVNNTLSIISAQVPVDIQQLNPIFVANGTSDIKDSRGIYHLPMSASTVNTTEVPNFRNTPATILSEIDAAIAERGYAVYLFHAAEYADLNPMGIPLPTTNATLYAELTEVIDGVIAKNYTIKTFNQVVDFNNDDTVKDLDSDGILDEFDTENIIRFSRTITTSHTVSNVIVQNGAVLTIPNGLGVTITSGNNLTIQSGSGILIKAGGFLQVHS